MQATIVEIAVVRKCRLAFDSIARRYARARHSMCLMSEENVTARYCAPRHASRLSNRLGNGISNSGEFRL